MSSQLTSRLLGIIELWADGRTRREIAETLGLSPSTVQTHTERIYARLGARNRPEAVAIALRSGWLR